MADTITIPSPSVFLNSPCESVATSAAPAVLTTKAEHLPSKHTRKKKEEDKSRNGHKRRFEGSPKVSPKENAAPDGAGFGVTKKKQSKSRNGEFVGRVPVTAGLAMSAGRRDKALRLTHAVAERLRYLQGEEAQMRRDETHLQAVHEAQCELRWI